MYDGVALILSLCTTSLSSSRILHYYNVRIILSVTPTPSPSSLLCFLASIFRSNICLGIFFTDLMQFLLVGFAFVFLANRRLTGVMNTVAQK